jgi:putative YhdH/YhfP family quinone oxidoreductase
MVRRAEANHDQVTRGIEMIGLDDLPAGEVVVRTHFSSVNYKDALAATGHSGVARQLPHVPGIDAAGTVVSSTSPQFRVGDEVMIFDANMGTNSSGGYSQYMRVPAAWVYSLPDGLSLRQAMAYGTAGFTAAQSILQLIRHDVKPESGEVVVTGATGGVGSCAVGMLAQLGYTVVAVSGKPERTDWLKALGAREVLSRTDMDDQSLRPLLKARWAGAVDTVGGNMLATVLRSAGPRACVTACGLVGGAELVITAYPFILRGVTLQGIDSANISHDTRAGIWQKLATGFALTKLDDLVREVSLDDLEDAIVDMLAGKTAGRVIVNCQ